ncbi:MAG: helix-turn-helix domain-containing protein [Candidatus Aenigmatarchaeota archaeon]
MEKESITSNDFEKKVIDLLSNKLLSVSQIAKDLKVRRDIVSGYLEALKNQGKLEFHKVGRSNVYTVSRMKK